MFNKEIINKENIRLTIKDFIHFVSYYTGLTVSDYILFEFMFYPQFYVLFFMLIDCLYKQITIKMSQAMQSINFETKSSLKLQSPRFNIYAK